MTSPILGFDLRFALKKRAWCLALATVAFLFILPIRMGMRFSRLSVVADTPEAVAELTRRINALFSAGDGLILSALLFGSIIMALIWSSDLHSRKKADFYLSLPVSRDHLYWKDLLSGFLCLTLPYLANLLLSLIILGAAGLLGYLQPLTLLAGLGENLLMALTLYAITFCVALICGNTVVSALLSLTLHGFGPAAIGVFIWMRSSMQPTWYSDIVNWEGIITHSSPAALYLWNAIDNGGNFGWGNVLYLLLLLAAAVVLGIAAMRRRPAENIGKALMFPRSRPWIKYPIVILATAAFAMVMQNIGDLYGEIQSSDWLWFFIGALLGCFISAQTIEVICAADFKAIGRRLLPLAIAVALFCGGSTLLISDAFGFNSYLPKDAELAQTDIHFYSLNEGQGINGGYYSDWYNASGEEGERLDRYCEEHFFHTLADAPAQQAALELAGIFIAQQNAGNDDPVEFIPKEDYQHTYNMVIRYTLNNGKVVYRKYDNSLYVCETRDQLAAIMADSNYLQDSRALYDFDSTQVRLDTVLNYMDPRQGYISELLPVNCRELVDIYKQELSALSVEDYMNELPVATLNLRIYSADPGQLKGYEDSDRLPYLSLKYPVYPQFEQTLAQLDALLPGGLSREMELNEIQQATLTYWHDVEYYYNDSIILSEAVAEDGVTEEIENGDSVLITDSDTIARLYENSRSQDAFYATSFVGYDPHWSLEFKCMDMYLSYSFPLHGSYDPSLLMR